MHLEISDFLIWLAAGVAGWSIRHVRELLEWRRIRRAARLELASPEGTNSPELAVVNALVEAKAPRVRSESIQVARMLNGTGPHRK